MEQNLLDLQKQFKRGWYRKGSQYRFLFALDVMGFLLYQTKTNKLRNNNQVTGVNSECDKWFLKAEYLGLELPEDAKKTDSPAS